MTYPKQIIAIPFLVTITLLLSNRVVFSQVEGNVNVKETPLNTSTDSQLDSSKINDIQLNKVNTDTVINKQKGEIEFPIDYSARDSININTDKKLIYLFGGAKISYGDISLSAEEIIINYGSSIITAFGKIDSLGKRIGFPIFTSSGENYETENIEYNYKTKRARISEVVTEQGDGLMRGEVVYKNEDNNMLSLHNTYTTCDLPVPHYGIVASKAKAIPGDKVVTGPFHMEVNKVPLPLAFPFGMFPSQRQKRSGIIVPSYGEEKNRGFFLTGGGYFFDISEYVKLKVVGNIYSKGASALNATTNYNKRYKYSGNFAFNFSSNFKSNDIEDRSRINDFRINWSHSPKSKGTGRFSASVNLATNTFTSNNFLPQNTNLVASETTGNSSRLNSNISYSKTLGKKVSLGLNINHSQNLQTKILNVGLPNLTLNVNNLYPFKKSKIPIIQKINTRYTMVASNRITNNLGKIKQNDTSSDSIAPFNFSTLPYLLAEAKKGVKHTIPLSTSFSILKYFSITTSLQYNEIWYFDKLKWGLSENGKSVQIEEKINGFNRVSNYSTSANMTTRIYGTVFFKNESGVQAIRHVLNPSIGFSYNPDFGDEKYGYYQKIDLENGTSQSKSIHQGYIYGSSKTSMSKSISFGLNNSLEMKVKNKKDTVSKKVSLLNSLSIRSSYNFAADSFKLAPFSISANTNILNQKVTLNISATLDPYKFVTIEDSEGTKKEIRAPNFAWNNYHAKNGYSIVKSKNGIGRITRAGFTMSTNINPKGQKKDISTRDKINESKLTESDKEYMLENVNSYIDFEIPWNLRLSYSLSYSHSLNKEGEISTHTVILGGDVSLSKKWKIKYNTGYDFKKNDFSQTTLSLARDLHCWQVNVSWTPFGKFQNYTFNIGVKSALLKDLKLNRNRSFFDNN